VIYILLTYIFSPFLFSAAFLRKSKKVKRILVIQNAKIGDLICSMPVFREIKKNYPEVKVSVICSPETRELLMYNPYVDNIEYVSTEEIKGISGKLRILKKVSAGKFDVCFLLNPSVPFSIAQLWARIPKRVSIIPNFSGLTLKIASYFNTHRIKHLTGKMVAETNIKMLKVIGIETSDITREVYTSPGASEKAEKFLLKYLNTRLVGIAVSSGNKLKELGLETLFSIVDNLLSNNTLTAVLIGSNSDSGIAREIVNKVKKNMVLDSTGHFNLSELPALIERMSLFIGVDSGITYMADALNIPLIDIAGPSDMNDQRPVGKNSTVIQGDISCVPCSHAFKAPYSCTLGNRECITAVRASDVVKVAKKILANNAS
jgi:ADP-heptose:LPS heptosyltransferase